MRNGRWMHAEDPSAMNDAKESADAMTESYHPADRPAKWRDLAQYCKDRAVEVQKDNERDGVPEQ